MTDVADRDEILAREIHRQGEVLLAGAAVPAGVAAFAALTLAR